MAVWARTGGLFDVVWDQYDTCMRVYREDPSRVEQDANNELRISQGGYSNRQIEELVQNAVDASAAGGGRVEVRHIDQTLYVANDGAPFSEGGVRAVMASDISRKEGESIGRFGIGFKSVLAVSATPQIFSQTVSIGFDGEWATETLKDEGFDSPRYPTMRLGKVLDSAVESQKDPHLREFMKWASTVIRLPLNGRGTESAAANVSKRIQNFRPEFVLFAPHTKQARIFDGFVEDTKEAHRDRLITKVKQTDGTIDLTINKVRTTWSVAIADHVPSAMARASAGRIADRENATVQYATKMPPDTSRGSFWAHFPTKSTTTLSGIVNAPWKLSDDRLHILNDRFNEEMLVNVLPPLVGSALKAFESVEDAAGTVRILDAMPARGREEASWADRTINIPIFEHLRNVPSLPDGTGRLRIPDELKWVTGLQPAWWDLWMEVPGAPSNEWVHPGSYSSAERVLKIERLMGLDSVHRTKHGTIQVEQTGLDVWFQDLVRNGSVESSAAAIEIAAQITDDSARIVDLATRTKLQKGVASARIIRLENGEFRAPTKGRVFVRVSTEDESHDFVDPRLAAMPGVREALAKLGIHLLDRSGELRSAIVRAKSSEVLRSKPHVAKVWGEIWSLVRQLPVETAIEILQEDLSRDLERVLHVRCADGTWRTPAECYLAGPIVPANGSRDRDRLIDPQFHAGDELVLRTAGAVEAPTQRVGAAAEPWLGRYVGIAKERYIARVEKRTGSSPSADYVIADGPSPGWPMEPLITMSRASRAAVTAHLLARGLPGRWHLSHRSNRNYGQIADAGPMIWFLRNFGLLPTDFGTLSPQQVFREGDAVDASIFPVYPCAEAVADALKLKTDPGQDLTAAEWVELAEVVHTWDGSGDDERRARFYSWLPYRLTSKRIPLKVRVGQRLIMVEPQNIALTTDAAVYESLQEAQIPALLFQDVPGAEPQAEDDLKKFIEAWDGKHAKDLLQEEIVKEPAGEASPLVDLYPPMKLWLADAVVSDDIQVQPCTQIMKMVASPNGQVAKPISERREGQVVYVTATRPEQVLEQVSSALQLNMSRSDIVKVFADIERRATNKLTQQIKKAKDDNLRLLEAVGVDAIKRIVPKHALEILESRPNGTRPEEIVGLARSVYGVTILKQLRPALEERGLQPPKEWAGRQPTRRWVQELGFPVEWAGFPSTPRPPIETIDGPAELEPLHDFQQWVTKEIRALFMGVTTDRGMVSLPTGAGKTRVTAEGLINEIKEGRIDTSVPLVWIAQSDELCEQAAETWSHVWRAIGPRIPMQLGRLWSTNEVDEDPTAFQLIIATIDKLSSLRSIKAPAYEWLCNPSVVVIDEAHTSIASSYTQVLEWMGRGNRGRNKSIRRPIIGLTATPFRGTSDDQTKRLVERYDGNRLDRGAFQREDPYEELQHMGVLAKVRQEILDGVEITLSVTEASDIEKLRRLSPAVAERLGADTQRTLRIVDHIASQPEDWTILLFAPSVEAARVLAGLLSHRGIPAVSISADTEPAARRHYVKEFKAGNIRVLTNYNVLTQGFDAPRVQAVYVTRPTFSPNVYQQMIGRGLRGPRNGGSEEVLIVNVKDNFNQYGDLLAFREFEYLWRQR